MARIYDVDHRAVGPGAFRVTFWSDAPKVSLYVNRNMGGVFDDSTLEVEDFVMLGQATEQRCTYDVERDGASLITVWLVPYVYVGQDLVAQDGTNGQPDRRRVVDLGV